MPSNKSRIRFPANWTVMKEKWDKFFFLNGARVHAEGRGYKNEWDAAASIDTNASD